MSSSDLLLKLINETTRETGKVAVSTAKRGMVFDLVNPVGVIAVIASDNDLLASLISCTALALSKGNAVILSTSAALSSVAQILAK